MFPVTPSITFHRLLLSCASGWPKNALRKTFAPARWQVCLALAVGLHPLQGFYNEVDPQIGGIHYGNSLYEPWTWRDELVPTQRTLIGLAEGGLGSLWTWTRTEVFVKESTGWRRVNQIDDMNFVEGDWIYDLAASPVRAGEFALIKRSPLSKDGVVLAYHNGQTVQVYPIADMNSDVQWRPMSLAYDRVGRLWIKTPYGSVFLDREGRLRGLASRSRERLFAAHAPNMQVEFLPESDDPLWPWPRTGIGLDLAYGMVRDLVPGSPAARAGIQVGDVIIEGDNSIGFSTTSFAPGVEVDLTWQDGITGERHSARLRSEPLENLSSGHFSAKLYQFPDGRLCFLNFNGAMILMDVSDEPGQPSKFQMIETHFDSAESASNLVFADDERGYLVVNDSLFRINMSSAERILTDTRLFGTRTLTWDPLDRLCIAGEQGFFVWDGNRLEIIEGLNLSLQEAWVGNAHRLLYKRESGRLYFLTREGLLSNQLNLGLNSRSYVGLAFIGESKDGWWFEHHDGSFLQFRNGAWLQHSVGEGEGGMISNPYRLCVLDARTVVVVGAHDGVPAMSRFQNGAWTDPELFPELDAERIEIAFMASNGAIWLGRGNARSSHGSLPTAVQLLRDGNRKLYRSNGRSRIRSFGEDYDGRLYSLSSQSFVIDPEKDEMIPIEEVFPGFPSPSVHGLILSEKGAAYFLTSNSVVGLKNGNISLYFDSAKLDFPAIFSRGISLGEGFLALSNKSIAAMRGGESLVFELPDSFNNGIYNFIGLKRDLQGNIWVNARLTGSHLDYHVDRFYCMRLREDFSPPEVVFGPLPEELSRPVNTVVSWSGRTRQSTILNSELRYAYRINRGPWSPYSELSDLQLSGLGKGRHLIEVKAQDGLLRAEAAVASASITVLPYFWESRLFYIILTSLGCCFALLFALITRERMKLRLAYASLEERAKELAEARRRAEVASETKSHFLANMSHEIRTPMNGVMGMMEVCLNTQMSAHQRELLNIAMESAKGLLGVINDILDFSKIESGKLILEEIPFGLRKILADTVRSMALGADRKGVELVCRIEPEIPDSFTGDPGRLRQVLVNLIGNAIKFTDHGTVLVSVEKATATRHNLVCLRFSVKDTGIGIPLEKQQQIFDSFSQADASTTRKFGGTGLGLSISSHLVKLMGGEIVLHSEVGKGSEFSFALELAKGPAQMTDELRAKSVASLKGRSVLIIDDNEINRMILLELTHHWGMKATALDSGYAARRMVQQAAERGELFDLILLDSMMPEFCGINVARAIGELDESIRPEIIMLSSAFRSEDSEVFLQQGLRNFFSKPILQEDLLEAILRCLGLVGSEPAGEPRSVGKEVFRGRSLKLLLAEDNIVNQQVAAALLRGLGHHVDYALNGLEVLEKCSREKYDAILMDLQMPEMDGLAATSILRERDQKEGSHTVVIALTAHALAEARELCQQQKMDGFISKPFNRAQLEAALQDACGR